MYAPSGPTLTPLARQLYPVIRDLLATARATLRTAASFRPDSYAGTLSIVAADWIELTILKDLLVRISRSAPHLRVTVRTERPRR